MPNLFLSKSKTNVKPGLNQRQTWCCCQASLEPGRMSKQQNAQANRKATKSLIISLHLNINSHHLQTLCNQILVCPNGPNLFWQYVNHFSKEIHLPLCSCHGSCTRNSADHQLWQQPPQVGLSTCPTGAGPGSRQELQPARRGKCSCLLMTTSFSTSSSLIRLHS